MEYCLVIKNNKISRFATTYKDLEGILVSEISQKREFRLFKTSQVITIVIHSGDFLSNCIALIWKR